MFTEVRVDFMHFSFFIFVEFGHNCGEQCKGSYDLPDDYLLYHSLAVPLMLGWSRSVYLYFD